jgi:hypothetical protein
MRSFLTFVLCLFLIGAVIAKNQTVSYEPRLTSLTGEIKMLRFPGPPNYTSIKDGDRDETGPYLVLNAPIDIRANPHVQANDTTEKNVKLVQVVVKHKCDWDKIREGNYVEVSGTLFHALTGHHHARVLIMSEKVSVIGRKQTDTSTMQLTKEDWQFLEHENLQN